MCTYVFLAVVIIFTNVFYFSQHTFLIIIRQKNCVSKLQTLHNVLIGLWRVLQYKNCRWRMCGGELLIPTGIKVPCFALFFLLIN